MHYYFAGTWMFKAISFIFGYQILMEAIQKQFV